MTKVSSSLFRVFQFLLFLLSSFGFVSPSFSSGLNSMAPDDKGRIFSELATHQIPVNFLSPGKEGPYSKIFGLNNGCPEGSQPTEIIQRRIQPGYSFYDMPLIVCMASADSDGGFLVPESNGQKILDFGGAFGQFKNYRDNIPNPISGDPLWHINPYTGDKSCDTSKGFQTYSIYGFKGSDWGINICLATRDVGEVNPYPDKRFHGFVRSENQCTRGSAKKIHGTIGSPQFGDNIDMDEALYLCLEEDDGSGSNENIANVVGLNLVGLNSYLDDPAGEVIADLSTSPRIPYDAAFAFTVKADVAYFDGTSSRLVGDRFPQNEFPDGQIPFQIQFEQTGADFRSPQSTISFAPYTINYTNENSDGTQTIFYFVRGVNAVGNYTVTATPVATGTNEVVGEAVSVSFEIYDPNDDDGTGNSEDTRAPTVPANVRSTSVGASQVSLAWDASQDLADGSVPASGVAGYLVSEVDNQVSSQTVSGTSAAFYGLSPETTYRFRVSAIDNAQNQSAFSSPVEVTTEAASDNGEDQIDGWTVITPSDDSRVYYVSNSHPDSSDSNDGLSPERPLLTLNEAYERLRSGYPDHMLLKRGDVWQESLGIEKGGRNSDEKMLIGAYGEGPRPVIESDGTRNGISGIRYDREQRKHLAFMSLHLRSTQRTDKDGITFVTDDFDDVLIEDVKVENFDQGVVIENRNIDLGLIEDVVIRRSIFSQNRGTSRSQGIFISGVYPFTMEENIFYQNGWTEEDGRDNSAGIFAHNVYLQRSGAFTPAKVFRNIVIDAGNAGIQMRNGGVAEGNVFSKNPLALGVGNEGIRSDELPVYARVRNNVILDPIDLRSDYPQGWGITAQNIISDPITGNDPEMTDNIFSNTNRSSVQARGISIVGKDNISVNENFLIARNIFKDFRRALSVNGGFDYSRNMRVEDNTIYTDYRQARIFYLAALNPLNFDFLFKNNEYFSTRSEAFKVDDYNESLNPDLYDADNDRYDRLLNYAQWMGLKDTGGHFDTGSVLLNGRPQYVDDERNLDSYARSILLSGEDELHQKLIQLRKGDWPRKYTADAISEYIREGFTPLP